MSPLRLLPLAVTLAALSAIIAIPRAQAMGFADSPCPEAGDGGIRVCPDAVVGQPYELILGGRGGCGPALPYQYRVLNGALPPGVSMSKEGVITGSPTSAGSWDFWLEVSDQNPPSAAWCVPTKSEREFRIRVGAPAATVGTPYSFALGAPGVGPGTWSLRAGTLPDGLLLDPAGTLSGIPTTAGSFPLTLSLTDGAGHETRRLEFALTVYPRFAVVSKRFPPLRVGRAFSARVTTQGAVGPVTYKVVAGRFPIGVRLDASTGVVHGKARKVGVYRLTIRATDSLGRIASGLEILTVRSAGALRGRARVAGEAGASGSSA